MSEFKTVYIHEVQEKIRTARDLLAMVLTSADSLNTLGVIMVEEILEGVKPDKQELVLNELLNGMERNFYIIKKQSDEREVITKANKIAIYVQHHKDEFESETLKENAFNICTFKEQISLNRDTESVKQAIDTYIKDCKELILATTNHKAMIKWHDKRLAEQEAHNEKLQKFGAYLEILSGRADGIIKSDKVSQETKDFAQQLLDVERGFQPTLCGYTVSPENCKVQDIFEAQYEKLEKFTEEAKAILD